MTTQTLYCSGCNEKFAVPQDQRECPQCGQRLATLGNAPTIELARLDGRETYGLSADVGEPAKSATDDPLLGREIGVYHVELFLGKGGMGRVYRARHLMLERQCALKLLNPRHASANDALVAAFLAEARAAAALVHPHVVTVHNIGQYDELHYIEMEYVAGRSLAQLVEHMGRLDALEATRLMNQVGAALSEAHRNGMVHRDIKPANVLVTSAGVAKLADFGLAKRVVTTGAELESSTLCGTPNYMAPEIFAGREADQRSDIYAMGVTYFYLLTGRLPFAGNSIAELARQHQHDPPPDPQATHGDVPDAACEILRRCLAKNPADRYADAMQLQSELRAVYGGMRSLESLLTEALADERLQIAGSGERFSVRVELPGSRWQTVQIQSCASPIVAERVVRIYSICGPASESYYRRALELNATIPHGSIAIESIDGVSHFVMANSYPRATCDPEEIRRSVLTIAHHSDAIEQALTQRDVF